MASVFCLSWVLHSGVTYGQAVKTNLAYLAVGAPNVGLEWNLGSRFTVNGDVSYVNHMWTQDHAVQATSNEYSLQDAIKAVAGTLDFRYYVKPRYYYTNNSYDGFYLGPYIMAATYNVGVEKWAWLNHICNREDAEGHNGELASRYQGYGVSGGVVFGYKLFLHNRLRLDLNIAWGYVYLQHYVADLSENGSWGLHPGLDTWNNLSFSRIWVPTRVGVNLCYILFK